MILCDRCGFWMHVVCMGFLNDTDKRIPNGPFECYYCIYDKDNGEIDAFVKKISRIRRAISIALHEGIFCPSQFANRLGLTLDVTRNLLNFLVREAFVVRNLSGDQSNSRQYKRYRYEVVRDDAAKAKIRYYFNNDLSTFPDFPSNKKLHASTIKRMTSPLLHSQDSHPKRQKQSITKDPINSKPRY